MKHGWEITSLGEVCELMNGYAFQSKQYTDEGYFVIRIGNVQAGFIELNNPRYIQLKEEKQKKFILQSGDILVSLTGNVGRVGVIDETHLPAVLNQRVAKISIKNGKKIGKDFIFHFLTSEYFISALIKAGRGAAQQNISTTDIENLKISIPPIPEQQRIVSILDKAFAAIDKAKANAEQNLKNAKELFESYLQSVFENKGKDWEEKSLEEICLLISKGSSPKWQGIKYVDEPGVLFVTSENVGENTLLLEQRKYVEEKFNISDKKSILKNGDVLTNIVGASIGRTAIFNLDDIANINQAVCLIRCNQKFLFNEYLMYLLNSPFTQQHLHDNEVNNARANLSLGFFRSLSIPLPELSEQRKVVDKIKAFSIETKRLETIYQKKIEDLEELKKSILQKAFSGELDTTKDIVR